MGVDSGLWQEDDSCLPHKAYENDLNSNLKTKGPPQQTVRLLQIK